MPDQTTRQLTAPPTLNSAQVKRLNDLIKKTNVEDPAPGDVQALRAFLGEQPAIWREIGDTAASARDALLAYASPQVIVQESIRLSAAELSTALTLPTDTPLEKLAVTQCVLAHILHTTIQKRYATAYSRGLDGFQSDFWEARLDTSQRRYLRSLEALARLRRLALPALQINIAETQTNITGNLPAPPAESAYGSEP